MKLKKIIYPLLCTLMLAVVSCGDPNEEPKREGITNVTIIYAVNHNNLSGDLINNRNQILEAAPEFNKANDLVLLYSYENGACNLKELVYDNAGNPSFSVIKNYEAGVLSTTPDRIKDVLSYVATIHPTADKTLFLWGHGLGPVNPNKYSQNPVNGDLKSSERATPKVEELYSYGGEYESETSRKMDFIDIDQLADAIPSGVFRTIWFDCCYMSSVEIAYQLRDKCRYLVAYPTEIMAEGLPYNKVLPYVVGNAPSLTKGAEQLFNHYILKKDPVTVSVMDLSKIDAFAQATKDFVAKLKTKPSFDGVVNYSRLPSQYNITHKYYDMIGWMMNGNDVNDAALNSAYKAMKSAYNNMMMYTNASEYDFLGNKIDSDKYFGISVYPYYNDNSERDNYYRKLDWWRDVASFYGWL